MSAPRRLLADAFPFLRHVQDAYREGVGDIKVDQGQAASGTLGTAFDVWVQLQVTPHPNVDVAQRGARLLGEPAVSAYSRLVNTLGTSTQTITGAWPGPSAVLGSRDLLRLAWASALLVEVYRIGAAVPGSPLTRSSLNQPQDLLALASEGAVDELDELADLARERLVPALQALTTAGPTRLGPTFAGTPLMSADADLVVGHTLVELKTALGTKSATGRRLSLTGTTLHQLLGYVLHDHDDAHQLTHVALYQARYGHFAVWPLGRLLHDLAGEPVDLAGLRQRWAAMLETQAPGRSPGPR